MSNNWMSQVPSFTVSYKSMCICCNKLVLLICDVCKLTKALYGIKQAPRAWFDTFSHFQIDFGFVCSKSDPSLFPYHHHGKILVLLLYVDDILLTGSDTELLHSLIHYLNSRFSMKDLGNPHYFL